MKKLLVILALLLVMTGCSRSVKYDVPEGPVADISGYEVESQRFHELDFRKLVSLITDGKTTIAYLGYVGCPWCMELVPELATMCESEDTDIWYLDVLSEENAAQDEEREKLMELIREHLPSDEDGQPMFKIPEIIYLQKGKILGIHVGTVNTHDAGERKMTEKELNRLRYQLKKEFEGVTAVK